MLLRNFIGVVKTSYKAKVLLPSFFIIQNRNKQRHEYGDDCSLFHSLFYTKRFDVMHLLIQRMYFPTFFNFVLSSSQTGGAYQFCMLARWELLATARH